MTELQTTRKHSRIGKRPVAIPKGVTVNLNGAKVEVQGPKGKLARELHPLIRFKREGDEISVDAEAPGRDASRLQGLGCALLASLVKGAHEGFERTLELVGTGFRCEAKG
jgi:large subunit ribosomal protein L6